MQWQGPVRASIALGFACTFALDVLAQEDKRASPYVLMPEVVTSATRNEHDSFTLPMSIDVVDRSVVELGFAVSACFILGAQTLAKLASAIAQAWPIRVEETGREAAECACNHRTPR